jgi:hypothetical protein
MFRRLARCGASKTFILYKSFVFVALLASFYCGNSYGAPKLFTYPPAFRFADGRILNSPETWSVDQITTNVGDIPESDGVVLIVAWSKLCPTKFSCHTDLIDKTIHYWAGRSKQVVLAISTMGFPMKMSENRVTLDTPTWVLSKSRTYHMMTRLLGTKRDEKMDVLMPDFRDPTFRKEIILLLDVLSKYDGNKTISEIRIPLGALAEDNPFIGPVNSQSFGFTETDWLEYCKWITRRFVEKFKSTRLEVDIGRLAWISARGDQLRRREVAEYVDELRTANCLLAFDGLGSSSYQKLNEPDPADGEAQALEILRNYETHGGAIGLEAVQHLGTARMHDLHAIRSAIQFLHPARIVFFHDLVSMAAHKDPEVLSFLRDLGYAL